MSFILILNISLIQVKQPAWVKKVSLNKDMLTFSDIEWTDVGSEAVQNKRYRFMSAEYFENYIPRMLNNEGSDEEKEKALAGYGATIIGAGLTNRPFISELPAIFSEGDQKPQLSENDVATLDMKIGDLVDMTNKNDDKDDKDDKDNKTNNEPVGLTKEDVSNPC